MDDKTGPDALGIFLAKVLAIMILLFCITALGIVGVKFLEGLIQL